MMAAILNSAILDSAILHSKKPLTQTSSIWLKLTHSHSTWWWQPSWILPLWIQPFCKKTLTQTSSIWLKLIHSHSTWWLQPSWILPCWIQRLPSWIQTTCYLLSDSLKNTLTPFWLWLKLIQSDSNSFILTELDDGSHLEFGHLGFSHLSFSSQTHSHLQRLVPTIFKKKKFTHSFWLNLMMAAILNSAMLDSDTAILDSDTLSSSLRLTQKHSPSTLTLTQTNSIWLTGWWQPSWILPSWIQPFCTKLWLILIQSDSKSFILTQLDDGSHLEFCHLLFSHFAQKKLHLFILTQLHDCSHLEFCHVGFRHCHLGFKHLVIFSKIHSKTLFLYSDFDPN